MAISRNWSGKTAVSCFSTKIESALTKKSTRSNSTSTKKGTLQVTICFQDCRAKTISLSIAL